MKTIRNTNSPPWIDGEVRHLIRKKKRCFAEISSEQNSRA